MTAPPASSALPALLPGAVALAAAVVAGVVAREAVRRGRVSTRWTLGLVVVVTAAVLFEAWTRGWVLSQAHMLLRLAPWAAGAPSVLPTFVNPLLGDAAWQGYPGLVHACRALGTGRVPLWDASLYAGHPFAASSLPAVFSPFTWAACLAPMPWGTVVLGALKLVVSGLGTAAFARALGAGRAAAAIVGVAGACNPFLIVWLEDASGTAAALTPWLLWATLRAIDVPCVRSAASLGLAFGLLLVSGQPETAFKAGVLATLLGAGWLWHTDQRRAAFATLAAGVAAGLLVAAVHLLPFLEYASQSRVLAERTAREVNGSFTARRTVVTGLVPDFYGNPAVTPVASVANRLGNPTNYVEQMVYPGAAVILLAAVGLARAGRVRVVVLATAACVGLALKYGAPGALELASRLPVLDVTPLGRFGLFPILATFGLAAFGIDALLDGSLDEAQRHRLDSVAGIAAGGAIAAIGVALVVERDLLQESGLSIWVGGRSAWAVALIVATAAVVHAATRRRVPAPIVAGCLAALVAVDLVDFARAWRPLAPASLVYPAVTTIETVRQDRHVFRVAGWGSALQPNTNVVYGLQQYRGYDSMNQVRYGRLLDRALGSEATLYVDRPFQDSTVFDLLNVKYLFTAPGVHVPEAHFAERGPGLYENRRVLPRALLADTATVLDAPAALERVVSPSFDPTREAVLERDFSPDARPEPRRGDGTDRVRFTQYRDELVELEVETTGRRVLVLTDLFYPGWVATVNGAATRVFRANYAFRCIAIPAGRSVVRFEYAPRSFAIGAVLSSLGAALVAFCLGATRPTPEVE